MSSAWHQLAASRSRSHCSACESRPKPEAAGAAPPGAPPRPGSASATPHAADRVGTASTASGSGRGSPQPGAEAGQIAPPELVEPHRGHALAFPHQVRRVRLPAPLARHPAARRARSHDRHEAIKSFSANWLPCRARARNCSCDADDAMRSFPVSTGSPPFPAVSRRRAERHARSSGEATRAHPGTNGPYISAPSTRNPSRSPKNSARPAPPETQLGVSWRHPLCASRLTTVHHAGAGGHRGSSALAGGGGGRVARIFRLERLTFALPRPDPP